MKMRRQRRRLVRAVGVALALLACYRTSWAQQGPTVVGQREKRDPVKFENIHTAVELLYRHEEDNVTSRTGTENSFAEDRFEERISAWGTGYIVHPNLVEMNLAGTFGLIQDSIDATGQSDTQDGTAYEWDVNATILRKEEAPITLYSRRVRDLINREFGPSLDSTITTTGGVIDWRNKAAPTRIEAYHSDQEQKSATGEDDLSISQNTLTWHTEARPTPNQVFTWDYTFNGIEETTGSQSTSGQNPFSFDTHDAIATHSWDFGPKQKNNLSSSVAYFNQSGDFGIERLRWDEVLRLRHTDSFETQYRYSLDQQSTEQTLIGPGTIQSSEQLLQRADASFTHRLYKSLVTTGTVGIQSVDYTSDDSSTFETFANLNFDYRKQVPFGRLTANLGFGFDRQENDARGVVQMLNISRAFSDPMPIVITGRNILPNSIVITDPSGLLIYRPGIDYRITGFGDRLELDRIIGGRINTGSPVLIDYALAPEPGNTTTSNTFTLGGRYDIEQSFLQGLGVYARYNVLDQTIDSESPTQFTPNSFTDTLLGAEYRRWGWIFGAEHQIHDSDIAPFTATRFSALYNQSVGPDTLLGFSTAYNIIDYSEPENRVELWTVSGQFTQRLGRGLSLHGAILYRNETDDLFGHTTGLEEQLQLRWNYRQFHFFVMLRNADLETDSQDTSYQMLQIGLRREF